MSDDLRGLLSDLARYLEQQQQAGGTFYLESPPEAGHTFSGAEAAAPAAPVAEPESVVEPGSVAPTEPAPASRAAEPLPPSPPGGNRPVPAQAPTTSPGGRPVAPPPPAPAAPAQPQADKPLSPRELEFQRQCAGFVRDALSTIQRTRQHGGRPAAAPAESDLFQAPSPEADVAPPSQPEALAAIADEVRACTACGLHATRNQPVPGAGHPDASLMLIGEAPGQAEDRQGVPFVGPSGKLLTDILKAIGFAREDVFIGNVLKCRPPGNRDPQPDEVVACKAFLRRQIKIIQPRIILCLGRIAAHTLLDTTASLRDLRRSVHFFAGVPVMATYHPAALLRNPGQKRDTWDDVRKLRALHDALGAQADGVTRG